MNGWARSYFPAPISAASCRSPTPELASHAARDADLAGQCLASADLAGHDLTSLLTHLGKYVTIRLLNMPVHARRNEVYRAIADPTRRAILDRLRAGSAAVNVLAADFEQSRPAISKHLRVLRDARLVVEQRQGRERVYELQPQPLQQVIGWIEGYRAHWQQNLNRLKRHLEDT